MSFFIRLRNEMDNEDNERGMGVCLIPLCASEKGEGLL